MFNICDVAMYADINECAAGGIAENCRLHGACNGMEPPGNFTCVCNVGYHLDSTGTACERMLFAMLQCSSQCITSHLYTSLLFYIYHRCKIFKYKAYTENCSGLQSFHRHPKSSSPITLATF